MVWWSACQPHQQRHRQIISRVCCYTCFSLWLKFIVKNNSTPLAIGNCIIYCPGLTEKCPLWSQIWLSWWLCSERFRRFSLLEESMSPKMGFEGLKTTQHFGSLSLLHPCERPVGFCSCSCCMPAACYHTSLCNELYSSETITRINSAFPKIPWTGCVIAATEK